MKYLKSEHLKFKRTVSNKLLFISSLITAILHGLSAVLLDFNTSHFIGGMRFYFREQLQFYVPCRIEKRKMPGNIIRYFLCL